MSCIKILNVIEIGKNFLLILRACCCRHGASWGALLSFERRVPWVVHVHAQVRNCMLTGELRQRRRQMSRLVPCSLLVHLEHMPAGSSGGAWEWWRSYCWRRYSGHEWIEISCGAVWNVIFPIPSCSCFEEFSCGNKIVWLLDLNKFVFLKLGAHSANFIIFTETLLL